jgi:glutamyl-tRNA reductase
VSVAYTAVEEAARRCGNLAERHALLIGAGKTGALAARHLLRRGIGRLTLLNRSLERAQEVASGLEPGLDQQVQVRSLAELDTVLPGADIALTATGSPEPIFDCARVAPAVAGRNGTPLYLFDVAVPRDVAPEVRALAKVEVIGLDELSCIVDQTLEARRVEVPRAEAILEEELREYAAWAQTLPVRPTVKELRCFLDELIAREMAWIRKKQPPETAQVVEESLQVFVKKIMQRPVMQLKTATSDHERYQDLTSLQRLFQLGEAAEAEASEG